MLQTLLFFVTIVTVCCAPVERRGACVIMCSPGFGLFDDLGLAPCPADRECRSTGCGTMCYLKHSGDESAKDG